MNRTLYPIFALLLAASLPAQDTIIKNGDFSDTTAANWTFDANGATANGKVELGRYVITIDAPVNRESAPQLFQRNINLVTGEGYTISFRASASDTGYIKVLIDSEGNITYKDSSSIKIPLTTTSTVHTVQFFVQRASGNTRLVFNCGLSPNLTRIAIDSVSITKNTTPIIRITVPSAESRWVAGAERQIQWQNSGTLEKVKIRFSPDSGASWSVITPAASNQKSYWWNVPASTAGNKCLVIISDTSGAFADTSAFFKIVAAGTIDAKEMVKNGDFLDTTNWRFSVNGSAKARGSFTGDQYLIKIDTAGTEPWEVKLEQPGFTLENGTMYRFSFDAYASHDREIFANVGADNGNPAWSVYGGDTVGVKLSTAKNRFYQTIIMKYPTSGNIRVEFNCGNDTGAVHIDNVSLIQLPAADVFIISPSLGQILKSGSKFNIEWQAAKVSTIDLEYSLDSCKNWVSILEGADNLGVAAWNVPDQSSEFCFIRIKESVSDSTLGMSAQFQINKFGAAVKTGELIVNGSFTNNQQGWNTSFDNAQGQTNFRTQQFEIAISEPGAALSSIVLSQSGLPVLGGKEYTLSFDAFANGTRDMEIVVVTDDTLKLLDTTVALPSVQKPLSFGFTAKSDAITRLEFRIGGAHAGVFIDNVSFYTGPDPSGVVTAPLVKAATCRFTVQTNGRNVIFHMPQYANGTISIFNLQGMLLRTLPVNDMLIRTWDGTNSRGVQAARGSYIAILAGKNMRQEPRLAARFILR